MKKTKFHTLFKVTVLLCVSTFLLAFQSNTQELPRAFMGIGTHIMGIGWLSQNQLIALGVGTIKFKELLDIQKLFFNP